MLQWHNPNPPPPHWDPPVRRPSLRTRMVPSAERGRTTTTPIAAPIRRCAPTIRPSSRGPRRRPSSGSGMRF
eukprot:scaffold10376_cov131-Isochrysis_galbana.AAC.6